MAQLTFGVFPAQFTISPTGAINPKIITDFNGCCGTLNQALTSNGSGCMQWCSVLQPSVFTAKGEILYASAASTPAALSVGTNGQVLSANSACASGLEWVTAGGGSPATPTVAGLVLGCTIASRTALGCNALVANTSGALNTAIGINALCTNTSGAGNTAIGADALCSNTVGCCNTAIGIQSLLSNTTGCCNTATGNSALYFNISGCANTANGMFAMVANTTGCCNTATGYQALCKTTTGGCNTATGSNALLNNTTGSCNVAVGLGALRANISGCFNVSVGNCAGCTITTGCSNVAVGPNVQLVSATGSCQLAIGFSATDNWLTGDSTKAIKPGAGIIDCASSTGTAGQVLMSNGSNAICWGTAGGGGGSPATPTVRGIVYGCTTGGNTALGSNAFQCATIGTSNVANGNYALFNNTTGSFNTATGDQSLYYNTTGQQNTAVGSGALCCNTTACGNTATGYCSLRANTTGFCTTATGFCALASNITGNFNVANGACALFNNTTGNCNIAVGFLALRATTGSANVAVGAQSGCGITSGSGNIAFGGVTSGGSYSPVFSATTENDRIVMGSNAVTNAYVQVAWTVVSDARDKTNVTALPVGLDFVNQLNPVSFQFKESRECNTAIGPVRYGFLAQEVLEAEGEKPVIVDTEVPESLKITNDHFNAVLVKAIQELSAELNVLKAEIKELKSNS